MSAVRKVPDDVFSLISDMESGIRDLARWGNVLTHLSASPHMLEDDTLYVVAKAVTELGSEVEQAWEALFEMSSRRIKP